MQLDYSTLYEVISWAVLFLAVLYFLYRNYIYSVVDPLFTYVYTTAFASVLILYAVNEKKYVIHYFICQIFLFLGFYFGKTIKRNSVDENKKFLFYEIDIFEKTVYILAAIYFLSNIFTIISRGSAFFSDDPYAREINFQDGFGIFRRINWGIGSFLASSLILLFIKEKKRAFLYMLIGLSLFTMLEGTKSSLLRIVIIVGAMIQHPYVKNNYKIAGNIKKYTPVGIIILFAAFFTILLKESSGNYDIFLSFINRLLAGGDSVLYFYLPQNEYLRIHYHPLEFIPYITNPITGFLHLTAYVEPFGSVAVSNTQVSALKADVYLAPNTPFYIEGQIFFGYLGAFAYSFCIGFCIVMLRDFFFTIRKGSYFTLSLLCTLFFHSTALPVETSLFVKSCLDTLLFTIPTYLAVSLIFKRKIIFRRMEF